MIQIVAPITIGGMILVTLGLLIWGDKQYHRMVPASIAMAATIPAWILAVKGRPMIGAGILISFIGFAIAYGMYFSGGIRAPAYVATLACVTICIILYGIRGGVIFAIATLVVGSVFVYLDSAGALPQTEAPPPAYVIALLGVFMVMQICFVLIPVRLMLNALEKSRNHASKLNEAMQEQKRTQKRLQSILNNTPDIIFRMDTSGKITFVNNAINKYTSAPNPMINTRLIDHVHPEDQYIIQNNIIDFNIEHHDIADLKIRMFFDPFKPTNVQWRTFTVSCDPVFSENQENLGTFTGIQGIARDISKTIQLEEQSSQLAAVIEQAAEDVVITDLKGIIQYVNPQFETTTGYLKEEVIGQKSSLLKSGKHGKRFYTSIWETIKNGNVWTGKIWNKTRNNQLILQDTSIFPIFSPSQKLTGYASLRRDITEHEKIETRLKQSQKMEAMGTLAGGVAHDFNNILGAIIGYAELILDDTNDFDTVISSTSQILKAGNRAKELVNQILLFSRKTEDETVPVKLKKIVSEVMTLLKTTLPSNIDMQTNFHDGTSLVLAIPGQIHQVIMNLFTNASHAMKNCGGTIFISIHTVDVDENYDPYFSDLKPGAYLKLQVKDTGHGIPPEVMDKIFDPFFTTKSRDEGTGLGLSVVHGIVKNHHGAIQVKSLPGQGTAFNVLLPAPISEQPIETAHKILLTGDEHILFIDDDPALSNLGKKRLERLGYKVTSMTDSTMAWETFQKTPEKFDLVITDKNMPTLNGLQVAQNISTLRPKTPIILCTGFNDFANPKQMHGFGIKKLLSKPVESAELARTIRDVFDE